MSIRIIVVDQDNIRRNAILNIILKNENFRVISDLRSGKKALNSIKRLLPNIVIIGDLLSDMSGYAFVVQLMKFLPVASLILTNEDTGNEVDFPKALDFGIVDSLTISMKNDVISFPAMIYHRINILSKLKINRFKTQIDQINNFIPKAKVFESKIKTKQSKDTREKIDNIREAISSKNIKKSSPVTFYPKNISRKRVIVIGASTGGPRMLTYIISQFPANFPPVLVVQHMPRGFVQGFAERMDNNAQMKVKMANDGEILRIGWVYIAQGGYHMELEKKSGIVRIKITEGPKVNFVKPAVDVTLFSAVRTHGQGVIGIILTGMGSDGREGCRVVKKMKGVVLALKEEDSVIYGMNKAVIDAGLADAILGMDEIVKFIAISLSK